MILEADETFTFERKTTMDTENKRVQDWEDLMWNYQQALPSANKGEKWLLMDKIFELEC
jgi:L-rhamnose mutarotase